MGRSVNFVGSLTQGATAIVCAIAFLHLSIPTRAADFTGQARIVDGDTLWIGETKIRLHGIDTPETRQKCTHQDGTAYQCGVAATEALHVLISSMPVRCEGMAYDRYKRVIAQCYVGNINLNAEMVRQGWALAYRRYSKDYVQAEMEAQDAKRGVWSGSFEPPWIWRKR